MNHEGNSNLSPFFGLQRISFAQVAIDARSLVEVAKQPINREEICKVQTTEREREIMATY